MIHLDKALKAWGSPDFQEILKREIKGLVAGQLPLQQGLSTGSHAVDDSLGVMIISVTEDADVIHAKAGIFYTGIIAGCSCADDPTPVDENHEYCVVQLDIDKTTAETTVSLLHE
jgi:hypothetical protein